MRLYAEYNQRQLELVIAELCVFLLCPSIDIRRYSTMSTVRRTGNDIPEDIWRVITSFLSTEVVLQLISVNRTFFNVALDMKYREVAWIKLDSGFLNILHRLQ